MVELEENNENLIHAFGWLPRKLRSIEFTFGEEIPSVSVKALISSVIFMGAHYSKWMKKTRPSGYVN